MVESQEKKQRFIFLIFRQMFETRNKNLETTITSNQIFI